MDKILIRGGKSLKGVVEPSGAKNSALPILAATLLAEGESCIRNIPRLRDIDTFTYLLKHLGAQITYQEVEAGSGTQTPSGDPWDLERRPPLPLLYVVTDSVNNFEAPYDLVRTMRASVLVLGPLLARFGRARVSLPGGCAIGARPINLHLEGLKQLGAEITLQHGYIEAKADRLKGTDIYLDLPTVTGTENIMMAATLAKGRTVLQNAAREPEVVDLAEALNKMGARIWGAGTQTLEIEGVQHLSHLDHTIMPDRIETGTFLVAAAITNGDIEIKNCRPEDLSAVIAKLQEAGVSIDQPSPTSLRVKRDGEIKAVNVKTQPYPGFPTDMQAQIMALMCLAKGSSVITETIFENRFMHVLELLRMGAQIQITGNTAVVTGVPKLSGAPVMATDLRASASLVLAGLAAEGETLISRVYHLDRGYERIEEKLSRLGADIIRIKDKG
jgi:UDP-N-acetylglucosamine 1-carboxyvinyltransferase